MGRAPCCEKTGVKKGPWTPDEDKILVNYIQENGHGSWRALPKLAGLLRCGKSCRLRWTNYLKPDIKRGSFTEEEERTIFRLHAILGNRWSVIASQLVGRTDNEIKNYWNTHLRKRLLKMGIDPSTHERRTEGNSTALRGFESLALTRHKAQWENARLEAEARLSRESLLLSSNLNAGYSTNINTVELSTMPDDNNAPTDYFLKVWSSEAGKVFRRESSSCKITNKSSNNSCHMTFDLNHHQNGELEDEVLSCQIRKSPRSSGSASASLYCTSTQQSCDKDNGSQCCNSASAEWTEDCSVKTVEVLPCFADHMTMGQTEHHVHEASFSSEELGPGNVQNTCFSELLMDFPAINNSNSTGCMIPELTTSFQQQSALPWPELNLEDVKDYWNNASVTARASAHG